MGFVAHNLSIRKSPVLLKGIGEASTWLMHPPPDVAALIQRSSFSLPAFRSPQSGLDIRSVEFDRYPKPTRRPSEKQRTSRSAGNSPEKQRTSRSTGNSPEKQRTSRSTGNSRDEPRETRDPRTFTDALSDRFTTASAVVPSLVLGDVEDRC